MLSSVYTFFHFFDPLIVSILSLFLFFIVILLLGTLWGEVGLYLYIAVAIIGANLQVLKIAYFGFLGEPIALGTVLFSSTYLCTDILNEYFGLKSARRGVMIGFASMLLWTLITQMTLFYAPLTLEQAGEAYTWALNTHSQMEGLFSLLPAIFVAGISAYLISQISDVFIYDWIRKKMGVKRLWLRNNLSTMISALVDNFVFSFIAFWLLSDHPVDFKTLIITYVLGTYLIRVVVALLDTPFLYFAKVIHSSRRF